MPRRTGFTASRREDARLDRMPVALLLGAKHNGPMKAGDAARMLGRRGGQARAARLSADARKAIASAGGKARSLSFHAARRITENFRYLEAIDALRPRPRVARVRTVTGPLPGPHLGTKPNDGSRRPPRRRR